MNVSYEFPSGKQYKASPTQIDLARAYFFLNISQDWIFKKTLMFQGKTYLKKKRGGGGKSVLIPTGS